MRTVEFEVDLKKPGSLEIPPEVAAELSLPMHAKVILVLGEPDEDEDWRLLTYQQFLRSYSDEDAIYDEDECKKEMEAAEWLAKKLKG